MNAPPIVPPTLSFVVSFKNKFPFRSFVATTEP